MDHPPTTLGLPSRWLLACLALVGPVGCTLFNHGPAKDYRTVQASATRDTAAAQKLHDQALALLAKCGQPCCCECVARIVCNPCRVESHLQNALVADVRYGPAHNTLGALYYREHKFYLAAWEFEYASQLMPDRPEPLNNLGLLYEESGKLDRALAYYQEAVELDPSNAEYLGNLARAQVRSGGRDEEARYWLEQVVFHDSRGEWVEWAQDALGEKAAGSSGAAVIDWDNAPESEGPELLPPPAPGPDLGDPASGAAPDMGLVNPLAPAN